MGQYFERYVNNNLLNYISRPQYTNSCSISALTAVFNYLFANELGIKTSNELAEAIGIESPNNIKDTNKISNSWVMQRFDDLCRHYSQKGSSEYFITRQTIADFDKDNQWVISRIKDAVKSNDQALIYHMNWHYTIVIGYFENAKDPDDAYNPLAPLDRWIVLGEHSTAYFRPCSLSDKVIEMCKNSKSELDKRELLERVQKSPIWCRRWGNIRLDIKTVSTHCIMRFKKEHSE